jgi:hypothetical protein
MDKKIVPSRFATNRSGTGKNIHRNYTGERNGSQMPDYISAMDIDEIVDYILEKED